MEQQPRGRAKARGRARSLPQTQGAPPPQQQGRRPGEVPPAQRPPQAQTAGPPPGFQRPPPQAHIPVSGGRATQRGTGGGPGGSGEPATLTSKMGGMSLGAGTTSGDGNGAQQLGRGSLRGRRQINIETVRTRPATLQSKKGVSGSAITLSANYFRLVTKTDWCLYQYRVDFAPEEDRTFIKKQLLRPHRDTIGGQYLFDGTVLYTSNRLAPEPMELFSVRESDNENIRITIKLVGDLMVGDYHYLQFYNMLTRKCLQHLKLQLVGRDYYDAKNKVEHEDLSLEIWPGYLTSIRQHDPSILMCAEITHKIMRQDTVYKMFTDIAQESPKDYQVKKQNIKPDKTK